MKKEIYEYRGVRGLVAAQILKDTKTEYVTGPVFDIAGVQEIGKTRETTTDTHYYDNKAAIIIASNGPDAIVMNASAIPYEVVAKLTGQTYIESKGLFIEHESNVIYFALGYITSDTDGHDRFIWRQKGMFTIGSENSKTKDNGTDASGQELTYTGIDTNKVYTVEGKKISIKAVNVNTAINPVDEDEFFSSVQTPDTIDAPVVTPSVTVIPSRVSVEAGKTVNVIAETIPAGETVTWTSSDTEIATVANGVITGVGEGSATITASITVDGTPVTDNCTVIVTAPEA